MPRCCFTGLRFSDISALSKDAIKTIDGKKWIETKMQKTNELIRIPIYMLFDGKPIDILRKYIKADRKYIFDDLTNQYVNRCLKDIAKLAGVTKLITFHSARHSDRFIPLRTSKLQNYFC